jgi:tRNA G18 (ribose-2'-O)-methylase SpoU
MRRALPPLMNQIRIEDPDDPRVTAYRDVQERDLVGRQGLFVAEGKVVLGALLAAPAYEVQSVLVLENRYDGLREVLAAAPAHLPVYVASAPVMDTIAGFHIHRGILAIGRRHARQDATAMLHSIPQRGMVLVLVGISNHDNIGSIFRNAAAFGVAAVFLDRTCCDPLYRKAIRVSVGGVFRVPFARFDDPQGFTSALLKNGFQPLALSPRGGTDIRDLQPLARPALFLGTEGEGLPPAILESMQAARISMTPGFDSLNVAATSAIALHQLNGR